MSCPKEEAVWRSASTGVWEPGLREHAEACSACRDVALVTRGLAALAKESSVTLPDPHLIWWRSHWLESQAAGERATRPIRLYQRFAAAALVIGTGAIGWANRPWLAQWTVFDVSVPILGAVALAGLAALLTIRAVLVEE
jgi:hypothetical protein